MKLIKTSSGRTQKSNITTIDNSQNFKKTSHLYVDHKKVIETKSNQDPKDYRPYP